MAAPFWQAGNLYLPGDLVQPITQPAPNDPQVINGGFEGGPTGWTFSDDAAYSTTGGYGSARCVVLPGNKPDGVALNNAQLVVPVGAQLTATCLIQQGASVAGATAGWAEVRWYDALNTLLQTDKGNAVDSGSKGAWHPSTVTSTAPASAAYARAAIHLTSVADHNHEIFGDNLSVSGATAGLPEGLVYKAVQTESGTSGSSEPAWPGILGQQVVDNEVIWEAVTTSRVTWTASARYVSGATEPVWPSDIGGMVQDGTINWKAISRRVEDEKCPNSKVVAIVAAKVFAADKDIVKFSATANPLDWSTADDAGYLPTGLQQANANDMAVLQQYRANLVALNASSFQNWQVDPDPASMAILDQMDGIGSSWPRAAVPVSNDLFYLAALGVRTIGIANAAENLAAGDVGAPIDSMVQEAIRAASANGSKVIGTYYPSAGQYWLSFADFPPQPLALYGNEPSGIVGDNPGDTQYVATGGTRPYLFDIAAGSLPPGRVLNVDTGVVSGAFATAGNFSWTVRVRDADGNVAVLPDDAAVISGAVALTLVGTLPPAGPVGLAAWSPDSQYLAVTASNAAPYLWVYKRTGDSLALLTLPSTGMVSRAQGLTWSPDGNELAVAPEATIAPFILRRTGDAFSFQTLGDQPPSVEQERGLNYSPDGGYLLLTTSAAVYAWRVQSGAYTPLGKSANLPATAYTREASDYAGDSTMFATGLSASPWLQLFSAAGAQLRGELVPAGVTAEVRQVRFSPDSRYLGFATAASPYAKLYQRTVDSFAFTPMPAIPVAGISGAEAFEWSPTSANFAVGSSQLSIFRRSGTAAVLAASYPVAGVVAIAWSPNGQYLAALRNGGTTVLKASIS